MTQRCDLCGPYTPTEAALLTLERWKPQPTGYLCEQCRPMVAEMGRKLADAIDARIVAETVLGR